MTTATAVTQGATVYDTVANALKVCDGTNWVGLSGGGGSSQWTTTGSDIYYNVGNVGIGTATPSALLDVYNSGDSILGVDNTSNGQVRINATGAHSQSLTLTPRSLSASLFPSGSAGILLAGSSETALSGATGLSLSGNGAATHLRVASGGNVGIGTTSPQSLLEVRKDIAGDAALQVRNDNTVGTANRTVVTVSNNTRNTSLIQYGPANSTALLGGSVPSADAGHLAFGSQVSAGVFSTTANVPVVFGTNNTERVRITGAGNVGIGTTNPTDLLHAVSVSGNVRVSAENTATSRKISLFAGGQAGILSDNTIYFGDQSFNYRAAFLANGNIGFGTATPTQLLSLGGNSARTIWMERHTTADTAGNNLTVQGGGASIGATDKNGGDLVLSGGTATGTGSSNITFKTAPAGTTGTSDRAPATAMTILGNGNVGIGTAAPNAVFSVLNYVKATASGDLIAATMGLSQSAGGANIWQVFRPDLKYIGMMSDHQLVWRSVATGTFFSAGTVDSGLSRISAAKLAVGNGTQGDYTGTLVAGNVGIGTTTPGYNLHIVANDFARAALSSYNASSTTRPVIHGERARGTSASPAAVVNGDSTFSFLNSAHDGTSFINPAAIDFKVNGTVATGSVPVDINFSTGANGTRTDRMTIASGGNVGIGTTTPNQGKVEVTGGSVCVDTDSDDNASTCIASESDARLKENVAALDVSLDTFMKLRPVSFDWKFNDPEVLKHYPLISRFAAQPHSIGLIAQEVGALVPEAIEPETVGDKDVQYFQLDYTKLVPVIIKAVQDLKHMMDGSDAKVEALTATVQALQAQNDELKSRLKTLESAVLTPDAQHAK